MIRTLVLNLGFHDWAIVIRSLSVLSLLTYVDLFVLTRRNFGTTNVEILRKHFLIMITDKNEDLKNVLDLIIKVGIILSACPFFLLSKHIRSFYMLYCTRCRKLIVHLRCLSQCTE
jgi:hypothetical protein